MEQSLNKVAVKESGFEVKRTLSCSYYVTVCVCRSVVFSSVSSRFVSSPIFQGVKRSFTCKKIRVCSSELEKCLYLNAYVCHIRFC